MRPIDADALKDAFAVMDFTCADTHAKETGDWFLKDIIPAEIDMASTLDAVPVVRCMDCIYSERRPYTADTDLHCMRFGENTEESDFCSKAERKECDQK